MTDFKFDPTNPTHIAGFRLMDEHHAKVADIKTIPSADSDLQFKFPDIRTALAVPRGTMYAMPPRHPNDTDEEWGVKCVKITGIGDPIE